MRKEQVLQYTVFFEAAEEGGYVAKVPALPGCVTQGESLKEARAMIKDAIGGYIVSLRKHGEEVPTEFRKPIIETIKIPSHKAMAWLNYQLSRGGFYVDVVTGGHYILRSSDGSKRVTVPYHHKELKRKTVKSILEQANLTIEEYVNL